jgi:hypothetical protein
MAYPVTSEIVTLAEVKSMDNISVTTYDTYISSMIPIVCRSVEDYCRRRFVASNWTQWITMDREIMTDNWPINNVLLIGNPYDIVLISDTTNSYNFNVVQTTSNNITIDGAFIATNTATLVTTSYLFSTYTTIGALKTAVEGALSGVTFAYQDNPTPITFSTLSTLTLRSGSGKTLTAGINLFDATTGNPLGNVYRISDNSDRIIMNPNYTASSYSINNGYLNGPYTTGYNNIDSGNYGREFYQNQDTLLIYNAGYSTSNMPSTLKWVVASIIRDVMSLYDVDGNGSYKGLMKSETLGDYSYTLGDGASLANIINRYAEQLDFWKKKVI